MSAGLEPRISSPGQGHGVQQHAGYAPLVVRTGPVPLVNIGSSLGLIAILAGLFLQLTGLAWTGVLLFGPSTLFALLTLLTGAGHPRAPPGLRGALQRHRAAVHLARHPGRPGRTPGAPAGRPGPGTGRARSWQRTCGSTSRLTRQALAKCTTKSGRAAWIAPKTASIAPRSPIALAVTPRPHPRRDSPRCGGAWAGPRGFRDRLGWLLCPPVSAMLHDESTPTGTLSQSQRQMCPCPPPKPDLRPGRNRTPDPFRPPRRALR